MLEDDFCDIIRKARFGLGFSLEAVAHRAGVGEARLAALETPNATPTDSEAESLAEALELRAPQLLDIAFGRYAPEARPHPGVIPVYVPEGNAFAYAVTAGGHRLIVDAGGSASELLGALGGPPEAILLTHGHRDHIDALEAVRSGAPVFAHPELASRIPGATALRDGEELFGFRAHYAPGHSADMLTFARDGIAFVGDTMFAGSLGRAMSPDAYPDLLRSARFILGLPEQTRIFPGHGPVTSVLEELRHNAFTAA